MKIFIIFSFFVLLINTYVSISDQKTLKLQLQRFSFKPSIVTYEMNNKYIELQQPQFVQLGNNIRDYAQFIVVDCQKNIKLPKNQSIANCENIAKSSFPILYLYGVKPIEYLINIRNKIFEITPRVVSYKLQKISDALTNFAESLIPNYMKKLYSFADIESYLQRGNHLKPKILLQSNNQQQQLLIKKLSIYFYERADFAQVIEGQSFKLQNKLTLYKYNFNSQKFDTFNFKNRIYAKQYENIKKFIQQHAYNQRIPLLFHALTLQQNQIKYADAKNFSLVTYDPELWNLVFEGTVQQGLEVISIYQQKYTDFFKYIIKITDSDPKLYLNHDKNTLLSLEQANIPSQEVFEFSEIQPNAQKLLELGNIVFLVEPSLDYFCSLENLKIFKSFLICIPIRQQDIQTVKTSFSIKQEDKLAILFRKTPENQFRGLNIKDISFRNLIKQIYRVVYPLITSMANRFITSPVFPLRPNTTYSKICGQVCLMYFHNRQTTNSYELGEITQAALKYNQWLTVGEGDYRCHQQLFTFLKRKPQNSLIFYQKGKYYLLKQKISLNNIDKLLRIYKRGTLKLKELNPQVKSNPECTFVLKKREYRKQVQESSEGDL